MRPLFPALALASTLATAPAQIVISEFLAVNDSGLLDEDGDDSDWLELRNTGALAVDLSGWYLTDDTADLTKWSIPAGVLLGAGDELLIFVSNKDRAVAAGELHTNFKLDSDGEYLALVKPDGTTVEFEYAPNYPPQFPDISYGLSALGSYSSLRIAPAAPLLWKVPGDDSEDVNNPAATTPWNDPAFSPDGSWAAGEGGVGYATASPDDYDAFIGAGSDLEAAMHTVNPTVYLRIPFEIDDPSHVTALTLKARWEDGFAAYINGGSTTVAGANSPADVALAFNSASTAGRDDTEAVALQEFPLDLGAITLVGGSNLLAVQVMNEAAGDDDLLFDPELEAVISPPPGAALPGYMVTPSPDAPNSAAVVDLGPIFRSATDSAPAPDLATMTEIVVTAELEAASNAVASVTLFHRQMFGTEMSQPMHDDGVAPDAAAGDGVFSAAIPLAGLSPGEMLRWRFEAEDADGTTSRLPLFNDPLNSAEYFGTVAIDPSISTSLPVLHWFPLSESGAGTRGGTRGSVFFAGEFYDNIFNRVRGGSSGGLAKKSYKFDFNTGDHFRFDPAFGRAEEFNLNTTWTDKSYIRQLLSYEVYGLAGSPGCESFLMHVRRNGQFFSVAAFVEQVDKRLLRREPGVDDDGALYKMFNKFTSGTSGVEKKNRRHENNADLSAFVSAINGSSGAALEDAIFDHVDIPRQLNYLAATVLCQNNDNMAKNYYLYRDTEGTGEWFQIAWDVDLTWGSHYMTGDSIAHDGIWADEDYVLGGRNANVPISPSHPFVGTQALPANRSWHRLTDKLYSNPRFAEMFRRRLRTLMDEVFAAPLLDDRIAALEALITPDAALDRAAWGQFGQSQTLAQAMDVLEDDYIAVRRTHLFTTHLDSNVGSYPTPQTSSAMLPAAQAGSPQIDFGAFEANPPSGTQAEEFIELQNPNAFAVDISGWALAGGVGHSMLEGTVIEAGGSLFLSPDVPAFRARAASPKGGEGNFVQGAYSGQLSSRGETVQLLDRGGAVVATLVVPPNPSLQQQFLRITELHYEPPDGQGLEFIELKNIGTQELDLAGVNFTDGITFTFPAGSSLAAGEIGILVSDPANYPAANVLGTYTGALNNGGEQITLRDAGGENILSFEFDGDWFPPARGGGYSIEILDETAAWDSWDLAESWVLSCDLGGSPSDPNPAEHSSAYEAWARAEFSPAELADPSLSGEAGDLNGDGVNNLLHYALGIAPGVDAAPFLPEMSEDGGFPTLSFRALGKAADLSYTVQASLDLAGWGVPVFVVGDPVDNGDGTVTITVRSSLPLAGNPRQFLRLRVTKA